MAYPNDMEQWQAGEQPAAGVGGSTDGSGFEYWQAGEQPPVLARATILLPLTVLTKLSYRTFKLGGKG